MSKGSQLTHAFVPYCFHLPFFMLQPPTDINTDLRFQDLAEHILDFGWESPFIKVCNHPSFRSVLSPFGLMLRTVEWFCAE